MDAGLWLVFLPRPWPTTRKAERRRGFCAGGGTGGFACPESWKLSNDGDLRLMSDSAQNLDDHRLLWSNGCVHSQKEIARTLRYGHNGMNAAKDRDIVRHVQVIRSALLRADIEK
jgi:hypothetical protein